MGIIPALDNFFHGMGTYLFYGGLIAAGATLLLMIITAIILSGGRRRLNKKLNAEYGEGDSV